MARSARSVSSARTTVEMFLSSHPCQFVSHPHMIFIMSLRVIKSVRMQGRWKGLDEKLGLGRGLGLGLGREAAGKATDACRYLRDCHHVDTCVTEGVEKAACDSWRLRHPITHSSHNGAVLMCACECVCARV